MNIVLYKLRYLFYKLKVMIFDHREPKEWECPNCHWDTTSDDDMSNAILSDYKGGFYEWSATANWTCPVCGYKFETWESN